MKKWKSLLLAIPVGIAGMFMVGCNEEPPADDTHIHTLSKISAVAVTCEEDGNSEYYDCTTCDKYFSDASGINEIAKNAWVIDALGHDYDATAWYDDEHQYVKTSVCSHNSAHVINHSVTLDTTNLESVVNPSDLADRNWSDYKITLTAGNYDKFVLKHANYTTGEGDTLSTPKKFNRVIGELSFTGEDKATTKMSGFGINAGSAVIYRPQGGLDHYVYRTYTIDTLKFENMTITDIVYINSLFDSAKSENAIISINNIVFENVIFDLTGVDNHHALHIISAKNGINNVIVRNCEFKNIVGSTANAILIDTRVEDDINVTVDNCTFTDIGFNAIQISGTGSNYTGEITITSNTITNTGDRAIRISYIDSNAIILISGNSMVNASDADGELIKASVEDGATVVITDNFWGSKTGTTPVTGMVNATGDNILDMAPHTAN